LEDKDKIKVFQNRLSSNKKLVKWFDFFGNLYFYLFACGGAVLAVAGEMHESDIFNKLGISLSFFGLISERMAREQKKKNHSEEKKLRKELELVKNNYLARGNNNQQQETIIDNNQQYETYQLQVITSSSRSRVI
jgi:hypothetical protein